VNEFKMISQPTHSVLSTTTTVTMSSLEMVEYINTTRSVGSAQLAHSDFLKKVPQVLGEVVAGKFSSYYTASNGKQNPCYNFPKREACLMAMSYSYELQAQVFDKMTALEAALAPQLPQDYPSALRELAVSYETNQAQQLRIQTQQQLLEYQKADVEFVEDFVEADGLIGVREAAKVLGVKQNMFSALLLDSKSMYRENGKLCAYSLDIGAGRFKTKVSKDVNGKDRTTTMFTPKGLRWISKKLKLSELLGGE
jgi:phage antirepressor YoqD-like protein